MEENKNKKPDGTEGEKPEDNVTPKEEKEDKKNKVAAFFAPRRNKIIVGVSAAAVIALIIGLSVGLSKCGSGNGGDATTSSADGGDATSSGSSSSSSEAHTHDYDTAWKYDATNHWHECKDGDGARSDETAHTFGSEIEIIDKATESKAGTKGYKCTVCGYAKDTFSYTPYISASNFEAAFQFTESKFSLDGAFTKGENNAWNGESLMARDGDVARSYNKWISEEDGTVKDLDSYYSREGSEDSYTYYAYSLKNGAWTKKEDSTKFFNVAFNPFDFRGLLFSDLTYDALTFDSASESYKGQCGRGSTTFDVEAFFNNGRLTKFITKNGDETNTYTVRTTPYDLTAPHVHALKDGYSKDATGHWKACSACDEKVDFAAHDSSVTKVITPATTTANGTKGHYCSVCDYQVDTYSYTPYISSAEELTGAMKFDGDKYTIDYYNYGEYAGTQIKNGNIVYVSKGALASAPDSEAYYSKESVDGTDVYYAYSKDSNGDWSKKVDSSKSYDTYASVQVNGNSAYCKASSSSTIDYSGLSYNEDEGRYSYRIDGESSYYLTFENKKLASFNYWHSSANIDEKWTFAETAKDLALPHLHTMSGSYDKTATEHSYVCSECGKKVSASHSFANILDLNASTPTLLQACGVCGYEKTDSYSSSATYSYVLYGYYPQTHVSDAATIASLNALSSAESNGWYKLGDTYYAKKTAAPYEATYTFDDGDSIESNTDYWFKVEPIKWKVSATSEGKQTIYTDLLLDAQKWSSGAFQYATSEIRTWLNGSFHDAAFNSGDTYITTTTVDNSAASTLDKTSNKNASANTDDKIYLFDVGSACKDMVAYTTDYARASGTPIYSNNTSCFWTRTPTNRDAVYYIYSENKSGERCYSPELYNYCVRPVTTLDLSAVANASN